MMFFAANSLLARLALREGEIDAGSFTAVRISAGAAILTLIVTARQGGISAIRDNGSLRAALALYGYAITFSFAYLSLDAGTLRANIDETESAAIITERGGQENHRERSQSGSSFCSQFA